jgi:hypothetical protein
MLITVIWMTAALALFLSAQKVLRGLGVGGQNDLFFWVIGIGVVLVAFYTSIGFCLAYKAMILVRKLANLKFKSPLYRGDGAFGLSFVGRFAFQTAWMFFSGWLFAPLIIFSGWQDSVTSYFGVGVPVATYFIFTVTVFLVPVYIVHNRMLREKIRLSERYSIEANHLIEWLKTDITEQHIKRFEFVKEIINQIRTLPDWPVSSEISIRFIITSILMPIIVAIISAGLRGIK